MSDPAQAPGNQSNGQTPAPSSGGNEQQTPDLSEIGSQNRIGVDDKYEKMIQNDPLFRTENQQQPKKEESQEQQQTLSKEAPAQTQPQNKDERHAATKIQKLSEGQTNLARKLVERDADAIYDIAHENPELAQKLLEEYDYGVSTVQELIALEQNPDATPESVQRDLAVQNELGTMKAQLMDEKVARLKTKYPDLEGEVEQYFRKVYSHEDYKDLPEETKVNVARALANKLPPAQSEGDQVALELLKKEETITHVPRGGGGAQKRKGEISPESRRRYAAAGVTEADLEKYLPENIDDIVANITRNI